MKKIYWTDGQPLFPETMHAWEGFQELAAMDRWTALGGRLGFFRLDILMSPNGECLRVTDLLYIGLNGEAINANDLIASVLEIPTPRQMGATCQIVLYRAEDECLEESHCSFAAPLRQREIMVRNSRWRLAVRRDTTRDDCVVLLQWQAHGERWRNDPAWVPPVFRTNAHPVWCTLLQTLEHQVSTLSEQPPYQRLQRLWPALRQCDPFFLYLECTAAFALNYEYSLSDPGGWLISLLDKISSMDQPHTQFEIQRYSMQAWDDGCFMINLKGKLDVRKVGLVLSIRVGAGESPPNLGQIRVAALSRLPRVLRMALPGVELLPESSTSEERRMRIAQRGEMWEQIVQEEMLGVFCGECKPYWSIVICEGEK